MTQRRSEKGCLYSSLIKVIGYFRSVSRRNTFENFSFPLLSSHLCQPVSNRIEPEIIHRTSIPSRWMDNRAIKIARRFSCLKYSYTRIDFKRSPPFNHRSIRSIVSFLHAQLTPIVRHSKLVAYPSNSIDPNLSSTLQHLSLAFVRNIEIQIITALPVAAHFYTLSRIDYRTAA